jgi:asparagine synthetase B (glutamine-hydrolysing)
MKMPENDMHERAAKNTAKYTTPEQIEARRKALEDLERQIAREKKELSRSGREMTREHDRLRVTMVGRFVQSKKPELWKEITESPEFNEYVSRDADRKIWGFKALKSSGSDLGPKKLPAPADDGELGSKTSPSDGGWGSWHKTLFSSE